MTQNDSVLEQVLNAKALSDLDGSGEPKRVFRKFARQCHPDLFETDDLKNKAEKAFIHLTRLKNNLLHPKPQQDHTLQSKKHTYTLDMSKRIVVDNTFSYIPSHYDAGHENVWAVLTDNVADNDLMLNYTQKIKALQEVPEEFKLFFPQRLESFTYRDPQNKEHPVAITQRDVNFVPLSNVLTEYPQGISGRNVSWIFRRMLTALGNAHDEGIVHGAPTLDSFWIDAENHGLILDNWGYAVNSGESLVAVPQQHKSLYPEYALTKGAVESKLDITLAAKTANSLLSEDGPVQLRSFFNGCQLNYVPTAAELLGEFDTLLQRIYGKPKFSELTLKGN